MKTPGRVWGSGSHSYVNGKSEALHHILPFEIEIRRRVLNVVRIFDLLLFFSG